MQATPSQPASEPRLFDRGASAATAATANDVEAVSVNGRGRVTGLGAPSSVPPVGASLLIVDSTTEGPFDHAPDSRWAHWAERDLQWSVRLHRATQHRVLQALLVTISRLGDGGFWYALGAWLMYLGGPARHTAWQMVTAGVANLAVYWVLKRTTARARPYVVCSDIKACARALDRGSFPSGHTMHAVCFATIAGTQFPLLGLTLAPFVALTALGRVALGLHYPSDVAAGAGIGLFSAAVVMLLM